MRELHQALRALRRALDASDDRATLDTLTALQDGIAAAREAEIAAVVQARKEGHSWRDIAHALGLAASTTYRKYSRYTD